MPISSSDRCTRISPSAILDDRLEGKDLEWARDHLRRCEACRDRVEEFREMLLRVGRLPKATVGSTAMDEAYELAVPERLREEAGVRPYELAPAENNRTFAPIIEVPTPVRPEVTSVPDMMADLEREIFHDEPAQDHPTPMNAAAEPIAAMEEPVAADDEPVQETEPAAELAAAPPEAAPLLWREVPVDSHQVVEPPMTPDATETDWARLLETIANSPESEVTPSAIAPHAERVSAPPPAIPPPDVAEAAPVAAEAVPDSPSAPSEHRNVIFDAEPAISFEEPTEPVAAAAAPPKRDTAMRLFVGFGAAAVVILAAVLYEGGFYLKNRQNVSAITPTARATVKASKSPHASASPTVVATPAPPTATVLYTLGNGVAGNSVFRIRPGTAVAGYTRLVFDMHGSGLPTMLITQTDDSHIQVIFKNATVTGVPVNGIKSYQIAAIEPGMQNGADGSFTIDLAHPVRVTAFTLPATGGYAWRLIVDLHTS